MTDFTKNKTVDGKPTVSIGIPAYNEEANIKNLLTALLSQKQDDFEILEIIVISDGSSDNTVKEAESVPSAKISIIDNVERKGKTESQNEILKIFKGDILLLLDADIIPKEGLFVSNLVKPFSINPKVGLVGGKVSPLSSENFFEKVINFSAVMKQEIAESINDGDNIYLCHGRSRALSKDFSKQLKWPKIYGEDAYSYLISKEKGFEFYYQPEAEILYRSPQTLTDHLRQSVRFTHSQNSLNKFFNRKILKESYRIPKTILIKKALKYFLKNPILFLFYLFIYFTAEIISKFKKETGAVWEMSPTSKILTNKL